MKIAIPMVAAGAVIAVAGRHSVLGLATGLGLLFAGWIIAEITEQKYEKGNK